MRFTLCFMLCPALRERLEEIRHQVRKQAVPDAVGHIYLAVVWVERETGRVQDLAERPLDKGVGRYVPTVPNIPDSDKAQLRIQPRVFGRLVIAFLQSHAGIQVGMQVVRSRQKNLALVHLELPGLVADSGVRALDLAERRDVAVIRTVEDEDLLGVGHSQQIRRRVYPQTYYVTESRFGPADVADRRDVAVRVPGKL